MAPTIRITLTGRGALTQADRREPGGDLGPLTRVALACLVLQRGQPVARDALAEALWDEELPPTWRPALRGVISRLRAYLGAAGLGAPGVLTSVGGSYELRLPGEVAVDVEEAGRALAGARQAFAGGEFGRAADQAAAAADLCRGRFLPGASGARVEHHQDELDDLHVQALEVVAGAATAHGDHATALAAARRAIAMHPLRESAHLCVIAAHAAAGNRAEALRAYERCRTTVAENLGVGPSPRMEATYIELLQLGRGPTTVGNQPTPSNVPRATSSFIGRAREIEEVRTALAAVRVVTLLGTGGVGKSRLATEAVRRASGDYPGGVWLLELAGLADPGLLASRALLAIGVPESPGSPPEATLVRHIGDHAMLVLLDNCEHLAPACAAFARRLLDACPGLTVLTTSREPLGLDGEHTIPVRPLSIPGDGAPPSVDDLLGFDAALLFADRATVAAPGLDLAPVTGAIAAICQQLDGIPLAIELAAARARTMTVPDIADRLCDRFGLLVGPPRPSNPRHPTMRDALDWSYDALAPAEQALFAELSVFAGGFTLGAAEAVCAPGGVDVLTGLCGLVDRSLVEPDRATNRYRMLETLRQYASQRLDAAGARDETRDRHLAWVAALARSAEAELEGDGQAAWLAVLEAEHDNIRAALDRAAANDPVAGVEIAVSIWRFYEVRGHLGEGRSRIEVALAATPDLDAALRAKALNAAGILAQRARDLDAARAHHEASLAIRTEREDDRGVAVALLGLGNVAVGAGDLAAARTCFAENIRLARGLGDLSMAAASLMNLGVVTQLLFDSGAIDSDAGWRTARQAYEESLAIYRELRDRNGIALALENLGVLASFEGDRERARSCLEQSLAMRRRLGDRIGIAAAARFLGQLAVRSGELQQARGLHEESLRIERELGNRVLVAADLAALADIAATEAQYGEAQQLLEESLALYAEVGDGEAADRVQAKLRDLVVVR